MTPPFPSVFPKRYLHWGHLLANHFHSLYNVCFGCWHIHPGLGGKLWSNLSLLLCNWAIVRQMDSTQDVTCMWLPLATPLVSHTSEHPGVVFVQVGWGGEWTSVPKRFQTRKYRMPPDTTSDSSPLGHCLPPSLELCMKTVTLTITHVARLVGPALRFCSCYCLTKGMCM